MGGAILFSLLVVLCGGCAVTSVVSFVLYIRTRLSDRGHPDEMNEARVRRNEELDRREGRYLAIHFKTLLAFFLLGVLVMVLISRRID